MTIQEQLNAINATFVKLHKDFVRFEAEKKSLASRFSLEFSRVQQKWDQERSRVSAVKEDVLKYYRIAKDNSSKELVSSGVGGQRPDIARLNRMIEQINSYSSLYAEIRKFVFKQNCTDSERSILSDYLTALKSIVSVSLYPFYMELAPAFFQWAEKELYRRSEQ